VKLTELPHENSLVDKVVLYDQHIQRSARSNGRRDPRRLHDGEGWCDGRQANLDEEAEGYRNNRANKKG
jgi:hypothetical protein